MVKEGYYFGIPPLVLGIIFAMVVGTCAAGGALGARFARGNPVAR